LCIFSGKLLTKPSSAFSGINGTMSTIVIALKDIKGGDEIVISYMDTSQELTYAERQNLLSTQWKFDCTCSLCRGGGGTASDARMKQISKIKTLLEESKYEDAHEVLLYAKQLIELYGREDLIFPKGYFYEIAAYASNQLGDKDEASKFAGLAKNHWGILLGKYNGKVKGLAAFEEDPEKHPTWKPKATAEDARA
jgi:hypothetical protein